VARKLRATPGFGPCVLIAMTGYGDVADHKKSRTRYRAERAQLPTRNSQLPTFLSIRNNG
jgi:hypothetical protein